MFIIVIIGTWLPFGILTSALFSVEAFNQLYAYFYFRGNKCYYFPLKENGFPFYVFYIWLLFGVLSGVSLTYQVLNN
jgi:hypothetical protein